MTVKRLSLYNHLYYNQIYSDYLEVKLVLLSFISKTYYNILFII